jgi:DNA-binding SARP family transcriptional activator/Flp pilus assembly protein TadD
MIRLRTLGALDLRDAGGQECRGLLAQPKRVALLAYLALATPRGPRRRDSLLATFWPELDTERARNALSQAVHFIRRSIGAEVLLAHNGDELSLAPSAVWCDAVAFEDALAAGRTSEALDLYRGELLDGFHVGHAPAFEEWLESERSRLSLRYVQAVETVAEERARAGDAAGALALWRRLAIRDPLNDRIALRYLRSLVATGDRAGALRHARVHELLLREELGVAPPAELTAFVERLHAAPADVVTTDAVVPVRAAAPVASPQPASSTPVASAPAPRRRVAFLVAGIIAMAAFVGIGSIKRDASNRTDYLRELMVRGSQEEVRRSPASLAAAKRIYEFVVREDSTFAPGYAALSGVYSAIARYGFAPPRPARDSARIMAQRAVALDSNLSEARTALGISYADAAAFEAARRELSTAVALDPDDSQARYWYAMLLVGLGRGKDALRESRRARELERFPTRGLIITARSAEFLATGERSFLRLPAGTRWKEFLEVAPEEPWAHRANAFDLAEAGECGRARAEIAETTRLAPNQVPTAVAVAMVEWWCGDRSRAHAQLERAKRTTLANAQAVHFASAHATWGEIDSAFVWLRRAEWQLGNLMDLRASRWLDAVRSDTSYAQLLRSLDVPVSLQK